MAASRELSPGLAGTGVVLASLASALVNLPIIDRAARNHALTRRMTVLTVEVAILGVAVLLLFEYRGLLGL
jgi:hypothetical protein